MDTYVIFWIILQIEKLPFSTWNLTEVPVVKDNGELAISCFNLVHRQNAYLMTSPARKS